MKRNQNEGGEYVEDEDLPASKRAKPPAHVRAQDAFKKNAMERHREEQGNRGFVKAADHYNGKRAYNKKRRRFKLILDSLGLQFATSKEIRQRLVDLDRRAIIDKRSFDKETKAVLDESCSHRNLWVRDYIQDPEEMEGAPELGEEDGDSDEDLAVLDVLVLDDARGKIEEFLTTTDAQEKCEELRDQIKKMHVQLPLVLADGKGPEVFAQIQGFFEDSFKTLGNVSKQEGVSISRLKGAVALLRQAEEREKSLQSAQAELKREILKLKRTVSQKEQQRDEECSVGTSAGDGRGEQLVEPVVGAELPLTTQTLTQPSTTVVKDTASEVDASAKTHVPTTNTACQTDFGADASDIKDDLQKELELLKTTHQQHLEACTAEKAVASRNSEYSARSAEVSRQRAEEAERKLHKAQEQLKDEAGKLETHLLACTEEKKRLEGTIQAMNDQKVSDQRTHKAVVDTLQDEIDELRDGREIRNDDAKEHQNIECHDSTQLRAEIERLRKELEQLKLNANENDIADLRQKLEDTVSVHDEHLRECSVEKLRLQDAIQTFEEKIKRRPDSTGTQEAPPDEIVSLKEKVAKLNDDKKQLNYTVNKLRAEYDSDQRMHEAALESLKSTISVLLNSKPLAVPPATETGADAMDTLPSRQVPSTSAASATRFSGTQAKKAASTRPATATVAHSDSEHENDDDDEPLDVKPTTNPTGEEGAEPVATHILETTGKKTKKLTQSSIQLVKDVLHCPVLNDSKALKIKDKYAKAEWYVDNTPHQAFKWITRNVTGDTPLINCIFCPVESCFTVMKVRSGSVTLTVRHHFETVHSYRRKCLAEGCRERWTKNMPRNTWCFKYDPSSNELQLEQVRCEKHSMQCCADECKNRWYDGIPETDKWIVVRKADGSVDAKKLLCEKHTLNCSANECKNRWYDGSPETDKWIVVRNADGYVEEEKLLCEKHWLKCATEDCVNRWYVDMPSSETWSVNHDADGSVIAHELRCPEHCM